MKLCPVCRIQNRDDAVACWECGQGFVDDVITMARARMAQGLNGEAKTLYRKVLQQDSTSREAILTLIRYQMIHEVPELEALLIQHVIRSPWDYEAIQILIDLNPVAAQKLTGVIVEARAGTPEAPPRMGLPIQAVSHFMDELFLNSWSKQAYIVRAVESDRQIWADGEFKRQMLLNSVKTGPAQMPKLWDLNVLAAQRLGMNPVDLYVVSEPRVTAYTGGSQECFICITTGLLDRLTDQEIMAVIGHELGHIFFKNVQFQNVIRDFLIALNTGDKAAEGMIYGLGGAAYSAATLHNEQAIQTRLMKGQEIFSSMLQWQQFSEYTADRIAIIACGSVDALISGLVKTLGIGLESVSNRFGTAFDLEGYLSQYDEAQLIRQKANEAERFATHPEDAVRLRALQAWKLTDWPGRFEMPTIGSGTT